VLVICLLLSGVAYLSTGVGLCNGVRRLVPALLSIFLLMLLNLFFLPWQEVAVIAMRIVCLVLCAAVVTATTSLAEIMQVIDRVALPLERLGALKPGDAGLAVGLCMRFIPDTVACYKALREAHRARGLKVRFSTLLGPLIILTLKQADQVATAIEARGLRGAHEHSPLQG
jgi:biotin transport system permease protein